MRFTDTATLKTNSSYCYCSSREGKKTGAGAQPLESFQNSTFFILAKRPF